jgi:hypothetical protein
MDFSVGIEAELAGGSRDFILSMDVGGLANRGAAELSAAGRRFTGEFCWARLSPEGAPLRIAVVRATSLTLGKFDLRVRPAAEFLELECAGRSAKVLAGDRASIESIRWRGEAMHVE